MVNIAATLLKATAERGDKTAFRLQRANDYRALSGRVFTDTALRISRYLADRDVGTGDRVMIAAENSPEWIMAALAVLNRGATIVPVASGATINEIETVLEKAKPKFVLFSETIPAEAALKDIAKNFLSWRSEADQPFDTEVMRLSADSINEAVPEDTAAVLIYTSGTTGNPKAVPLTHKNILTNAADIKIAVRASKRDRLVSVLPLSHMLEFTGGFVSPILFGATITYARSLKGEDIVRALKDTRATIMIGVPLLYEIMMRGLRAKLDQLPPIARKILFASMYVVEEIPVLGRLLFLPVHLALGMRIRFFISGGSRLHPDVYRFFRGVGIPMVQGYGLTETSPVLCATDYRDNDPEFVGRPLNSVELGVFNDRGEKVLVGVEGEIWARGPSVFSGYLEAAQNKDAFQDGWFKTGDLGILDYRNMLRITGRKKDIIVTAAGKNVYPEEIESLVLSSGKFLEVAVFGMKDGDSERVVMAVVPDRAKFPQLPEAEFRREVESVVQGICKVLSDYKWPQRIEVFTEELPKTVTRKIKKHEVRKLVEKRDRAKPEETAALSGAALDQTDALEECIAGAIANIRNIRPEGIKSTDILNRDLGIDSLTFVEIIGAVEKRFSTTIEGVEFAAIATVGDLIGALRPALEKSGKIAKKKKVRFVEFEPIQNLDPLWAWPRRFFNVFLRAGLKIHYRMAAEGIEHVREGGPFVFTPNHTSHFDTLAVMAAIPGRDVHYTFAVAAKDYFFNKTWKAAAARLLINALPFDRKARIEESMERCENVLERGGSLVIFPEGTRSPTGQIQDFKPGVGRLLAGREKVKAVPVYIAGAHDILPKGTKVPRGLGVQLKIYFGEPISFEGVGATPDAYRQIALKLQSEVERLEKLHQGGH